MKWRKRKNLYERDRKKSRTREKRWLGKHDRWTYETNPSWVAFKEEMEADMEHVVGYYGLPSELGLDGPFVIRAIPVNYKGTITVMETK